MAERVANLAKRVVVCEGVPGDACARDAVLAIWLLSNHDAHRHSLMLETDDGGVTHVGDSVSEVLGLEVQLGPSQPLDRRHPHEWRGRRVIDLVLAVNFVNGGLGELERRQRVVAKLAVALVV
eukprot:scaffold175734_cov28-Tisochrysis_lutea.AAC.3